MLLFSAYWSEKEKEIMYQVFQRNLQDGILPGLKMCGEIQQKYPELLNRTAATLRAWVNNTIKKNKRQD